MKLILRQYLADLRERGELDAILPDLLSEIGFNVLSRPSRGTRQAGVDVAAIGPDEDDGEKRRKLFLFTIKSGNLRRKNWDDGSPQAVRPSLNEIRDEYIHSRVPQQYQSLDIAICLCIGGEIKEDVRALWKGYIEENRSDKISFREWNGDKLAELLLSGVLKEEILETRLQTHFRKSIAMVDHPDVAYRFFTLLIQGLLEDDVNKRGRSRITKLRQVYICLWVLFVWARDAGNLEAPLRASEYALLHIWNECRSMFGEQTKEQKERAIRIGILKQTIGLHLLIADGLVMKKLGTYAEKPFALSMAVASHSSVDVNLALFEQFGRLSLYGLWQHWGACLAQADDNEVDATEFCRGRNRLLEMAVAMINNNPALKSPIRDDFAIEIALFMLLAQVCGTVDAVSGYLEQMAYRLKFSIERRTAYPVPSTGYNDLVGHPANRSDEYFKQHTRGSVLYPLLVAWLDRLNLRGARDALAACIEKNLSHTTQQVWVPNGNTDERLWVGRRDHGVAIPDLPICEGPSRYAELLDRVIADHTAFNDLSTTKYELFAPIFLMACRHFRMPIPPHLWFLEVPDSSSAEELGQ